MIKSLILRTAARLLVPLLLLFSIFMLLRGHNSPGGGFVGGLMGAAAFALYAFSRGYSAAASALYAAPPLLLAVGLSCALGSGVLAWSLGHAFLTSVTTDVSLAFVHLHLSTTLLFDTGVYLVVVGAVLLIVFSIEDRGSSLARVAP